MTIAEKCIFSFFSNYIFIFYLFYTAVLINDIIVILFIRYSVIPQYVDLRFISNNFICNLCSLKIIICSTMCHEKFFSCNDSSQRVNISLNRYAISALLQFTIQKFFLWQFSAQSPFL